MPASQPLNVTAFIDRQPLSAFQVTIVVLCFLIVAVDGFDTAAIGFIAPAIRAEWQLTPAQLAPLFGRPLRPQGRAGAVGAVLRRGQPGFGVVARLVDAGAAALPDRPGPGRRHAQRDHADLRVLPGQAPLLPGHHHVLRLHAGLRLRRPGLGRADRRLRLALGTGGRRRAAAATGGGAGLVAAGIGALPGDDRQVARAHRCHAAEDRPA
ncbi:MFS transporter, aromatic acid:H+ symporter (AAHS) family [compost metagenome]